MRSSSIIDGSKYCSSSLKRPRELLCAPQFSDSPRIPHPLTPFFATSEKNKPHNLSRNIEADMPAPDYPVDPLCITIRYLKSFSYTHFESMSEWLNEFTEAKELFQSQDMYKLSETELQLASQIVWHDILWVRFRDYFSPFSLGGRAICTENMIEWSHTVKNYIN